jgi:hypothetical protein
MDGFAPEGLVLAFFPAPFLASAFLPPVLLRLVFFWPAFAAGVFAILTPRSALPDRHASFL